jgi:hypothetical protein
VTVIRRLPLNVDLHERVAEILEANVLRPADTTAWSRTDIRNAFTNADEHMLLASSLDLQQFDPAERESAAGAIKRIRSAAKAVRHKGQALLFWRATPLAKAVADSYRKAIAKNYLAMIDAGSVLVMIDEPRNVSLYKSLCTKQL